MLMAFYFATVLFDTHTLISRTAHLCPPKYIWQVWFRQIWRKPEWAITPNTPVRPTSKFISLGPFITLSPCNHSFNLPYGCLSPRDGALLPPCHTPIGRFGVVCAGSGFRLNCSNDADISPTPPQHFTGSESVKFFICVNRTFPR